ncbi:MAG: hypothetical protein WC823_07065 [Parcubacteria group bacterium]|jgi:hypothetical protein
MLEAMRGVVSSEELKNNTRELERVNAQIENSGNDREKEEFFKKAEQIESELNRIEEVMGIDAEEMLSFYEAITPQDARDVVTKTIERIPMGFMKGTLWTVDNLREFGGKIMLWASIKSPREAAIIAASVMILTMGGGMAQEAMADESEPVEITHMADANMVEMSNNNTAQEGLGDLEVVSVSNERLNKLNDALNIKTISGMENTAENRYSQNMSNMSVNGEAARIIEENSKEKIYGNSHSIYSRDVHVGIVHMGK